MKKTDRSEPGSDGETQMSEKTMNFGKSGSRATLLDDGENNTDLFDGVTNLARNTIKIGEEQLQKVNKLAMDGMEEIGIIKT